MLIYLKIKLINYYHICRTDSVLSFFVNFTIYVRNSKHVKKTSFVNSIHLELFLFKLFVSFKGRIFRYSFIFIKKVENFMK